MKALRYSANKEKTFTPVLFLIFVILFSAVLSAPSWAMLGNSVAPHLGGEDVEPKPKTVNKGWNQKQRENARFIPGFNTNFQNDEVKKEEVKLEIPSIKATPDGEQKLPAKSVFAMNRGWKKTHPDLISYLSRDPQNIQKKEVILVKSSSEEENNNGAITVDGSSEEDFIESSEDDHRKKTSKLRTSKRLKKKNRKYEESSSSVESTSSSADSEDSRDGNTSFTVDSDCSSDDQPSTPSIDEDYVPSLKSRKSRSYPIVTTRSSKITSKRKNSSPPSFATTVESEEEDLLGRIIPYAENTEDFNLVTTMGMRLKLLANAYLANLVARPNIFLPHFTLEVECPNGTFEIKSFFETPKGEICVFASGGLHHIWEKNIGHINKIFFGERVKIIRSHWMQKHLQKDCGIERDLDEEFSGREYELHSEFYYDLFFRHFFVHELDQFANEGGVTLKRLTIHAFSWWDVCNHCEELLSIHKPPLKTGLELSYKIAARKRYNHFYPDNSLVEDYALPKTVEEEAWKAIWDSLSPYTRKSFAHRKEKEIFWTRTKDGLEICKWLGQAFRERTKGLDGKAKAAKKGDVLAFYRGMQPKKTKALEKLLSYLQDKNWDLSCWYRGPNYPSPYQSAWNRFGKQLIRPYFGWEEVTEYKIKDKERSDQCEMCGYEKLMNVHYVFHRKHHASNKFLSLPEEDQKLRERDFGFTIESRVSDFPDVLKQKRKQCLHVGSECIQYLCLSKEYIEEWRETHPAAEANTEWEIERLASYDVLDRVEKNLKGSEKKRQKK